MAKKKDTEITVNASGVSNPNPKNYDILIGLNGEVYVNNDEGEIFMAGSNHFSPAQYNALEGLLKALKLRKGGEIVVINNVPGLNMSNFLNERGI